MLSQSRTCILSSDKWAIGKRLPSKFVILSLASDPTLAIRKQPSFPGLIRAISVLPKRIRNLCNDKLPYLVHMSLFESISCRSFSRRSLSTQIINSYLRYKSANIISYLFVCLDVGFVDAVRENSASSGLTGLPASAESAGGLVKLNDNCDQFEPFHFASCFANVVVVASIRSPLMGK